MCKTQVSNCGSLYVRLHRREMVAKLGGAKCVKCRQRHARTEFPHYNLDHFILLEIPITFLPYDWSLYQLDNCIIPYISRKYEQPWVKYDACGGTEFYQWKDDDWKSHVSNLEDCLIQLGVKFEKVIFHDNLEKWLTTPLTDEEEDQILKEEFTKVRDKKKIVDLNVVDRLMKLSNWEYVQGYRRTWQILLQKAYQNILQKSPKKSLYSGVVVAPTGCGKSRGEFILAVEQIKRGKSALLTTKYVGLFRQLKLSMQGMKDECGFDFNIVDMTVDSQYTSIQKIKFQPSTLYLANLDWLTNPKREKLFQKDKVDTTHLRLVLHDECQWIAGNKVMNLLNWFKDRCHLIGFSATPARICHRGIFNAREAYGNQEKLNILYQVFYKEAIKANYLSPFKIRPLWYTEEDLGKVLTDDEKVEGDEGHAIRGLSDKGSEKLAREADRKLQELNRSGYRKVGLIFCRNRKDLRNRMKHWTKLQKEAGLFQGITMLCSYTCQSDDRKFLKKMGLDESKVSGKAGKQDYVHQFKKSNHTLMFTVMRCGEGFNFPELKWGVRAYVTQEMNTVLELQRLGRFTRVVNGCSKMEANYWIVMHKGEDNSPPVQLRRFIQDVTSYLNSLKFDWNHDSTDDAEEEDKLSSLHTTWDQFFDIDVSEQGWTFDDLYQSDGDSKKKLRILYRKRIEKIQEEKKRQGILRTTTFWYYQQAKIKNWSLEPEHLYKPLFGKDFPWAQYLSVYDEYPLEHKAREEIRILLVKEYGKKHKYRTSEFTDVMDRYGGDKPFPDSRLWQSLYEKHFSGTIRHPK